jgi:hypothetical protein
LYWSRGTQRKPLPLPIIPCFVTTQHPP